jgi:hypothetical protein
MPSDEERQAVTDLIAEQQERIAELEAALSEALDEMPHGTVIKSKLRAVLGEEVDGG